MAPQRFPTLGARLAAPKISRARAHPSHWLRGLGGHEASAGSQVLVGQMGVRDNLPGCPCSPTKTLTPANPSSNTALVPPLCLSFPFRLSRRRSWPPLPQGSCRAGRAGAGMRGWEGPAPRDRRSLLRGLTGRFVPSAVGRGERSRAARPAPPGRRHGAAVGAAGTGWDGRSRGPG